MTNFNQQVITAFFKATFITTMIFGTLLAQSWATSALFSDERMKMNIEFTASSDDVSSSQRASMSVHNKQESSIAFGDHQLNIKTTFIKWSEEATKAEEIFAEVLVLKKDAEGHFEPTHKPSFMIGKDQWAEFKIEHEQGQEGIELKMQFEDFNSLLDEHSQVQEPEWLNWEQKQVITEAC